MIDIQYLKKLVEALIQADPYSNVYEGFSTQLRNIEKKIDTLGNQIRREVSKFID